MESKVSEKTKRVRKTTKIKVIGESKIKKSKNYSEENIKEALTKIIKENWTVYKAAKSYKIPWSTLKGRLAGIDQENLSLDTIPSVKVGRPFNLSEDDENKVISYIQNLQSIGFDINCSEVRKYAYNLSKSKDKNFFSKTTPIAGWSWWGSFKKRYQKTLNLQEYCSIIRNTNNVVNNLKDFYTVLKNQLEKIDSAQNIWNLGDLSFCYSLNDLEVSEKKKKLETATAKHKMVTFYSTINASGESGASQLVFRRKSFKTDLLGDGIPSNFSITSSNSKHEDDFFQFLQFFVTTVSISRPIIILMNSQNHPVSPQSLEFLQINEIILLPFPARIDKLINPINIAVFKPLRQSLNQKVFEANENEFLKVFMPLFNEIKTSDNILKAFEDTGIYPLNPDVKIDWKMIANVTQFPTPVNENENMMHCYVCDEYGFYDESIKWIQCNDCECWFHFICVNVNEYFPNFVCEKCTDFFDDLE